MTWNDERWATLHGGYRIAFDPRPLLLQIKSNLHSEELWHELIEDLYHQGDVGEASYATVPELAHLVPPEEDLPWQLVGLVQWIEEARSAGTNPPLPIWITKEYFAAIETLGRRCLIELGKSTTELQNRCFIAFIALWKGMTVYANAIGNYSEDELKDFLTE